VTISDLAMLDDLRDELERGRVYECSLRARFRLDGLQDGQEIYIDPRPAIIETVIHELMHRRKPRWGERRVSREAKRLVLLMDDPEMAVWWRRYQRIKRKGRPVQADDE
jgi:hypothetical protein